MVNRVNLNDKRQLLTALFSGDVDILKTYRANQLRANSPYRWIIHDIIAGTIHGVGKDGSQSPLTSDDLAQAPPTCIIRIVDFSDGSKIPGPDEDYSIEGQ